MKQRRAVLEIELKDLLRGKWSQTFPPALAKEVPDWPLQKEPFQLIEGQAYFGGTG